MELIAFKLSLSRRSAAATVRTAHGTVQAELTAAAIDRVLAAAEPLLVRLAQLGDGPVQFLSIHHQPPTVLAACLGGDARPLSAQDLQALFHQHGVNMGEVGEAPPHLRAVCLTGEGFQPLAALVRDVVRVAAREAIPRMPDPPGLTEAELWEHKYHHRGDGWELMRPAPPLLRYLDQVGVPGGAGQRALVPGCGRGHEARLLAERDTQVVAIDVAPAAVQAAQALAAGLKDRIDVRLQDLFTLEGDPGGYDLWLEHCCFCAIPRDRRAEYVRVAHRLLRPDGLLLGLFWCHPYPGGPPFGATRAEVVDLFGASFDVVHEEVPADSILSRAQQELMLLLRRRG